MVITMNDIIQTLLIVYGGVSATVIFCILVAAVILCILVSYIVDLVLPEDLSDNHE
jgi:hypothetical protein